MTRYVIGLDIGTTSTIGLLMEPPATVIATAKRDVVLTSLHPGWAEEDPAQWWENATSVLSELAAQCGSAEIAGICVTGMLPALVMLDAQGRVIRASIQQSDGRCTEQVDEMRGELDEDAFLRRTGNGINQQLIAAKLRWIKRHEPASFARIATVFGSYDYINWRLTGRRAVEQNWALEAGFTDLSTHRIADDLVALAHIPPSAVPRRSLSHEVMGHVTAKAASRTGLPEGLPVFGGAADHIVSALAAGISRSGDILLKFGGAGDIVVAADTVQPDARLFLDYHLVPGLYAPNGCMATSGSALNWLAEMIAPDGSGARPHSALDTLAESVPPGSDGLRCLPYFLGEKTPLHDPLARGVFVGLSLDQSRGHMWRALLEGVAFGFRHHIDVLEELGFEKARVRASDGGTASAVWMQIVADVIGMPVQLLDNHHGSSLGAAFVAAVGAGLADWDDAAALAGAGATIQPDPANAVLYDAAYREFHEVYGALRPLLHARAGR